MSSNSIVEIKKILVEMIEQEGSEPMKGLDDFSIAKGKERIENGTGKYVWQVRHAGLLGLKYLVAVRNDLLRSGEAKEVVVKEEDGDIKMKTFSELDLLRDVVNASLLG